MAAGKGQAGGDFGRRRLAVAGRAPWDRIGDVHAAPVEPDRGQHAVEQLADVARKRRAGAVVVGARSIAHQHQRGGRVAVGKNQIGRGGFEGAALEGGDRRPQFGQALGGGGGRPGGELGLGCRLRGGKCGGGNRCGRYRDDRAGRCLRSRGCDRRRRGQGCKPVERGFADCFVGPGLDQPAQGGKIVHRPGPYHDRPRIG